MITLLGGSGYIGQAFAHELDRRGREYTVLSRSQFDYTRFGVLLDYLQMVKPELLINAAGYTGKPNVDGCETARAETLAGNTLFPQTVAQACMAAGTAWGHVSSGCIYSGAKVTRNGAAEIEPDLLRPEIREIWEGNRDAIAGFSETDEPNFSFSSPPCSFYSGTKAMAEEAISRTGPAYIWRLRIPFDEEDHPRNYLTKIQRYSKVYDNVNSISHRGDFARACLDLWEKGAPAGIYNVTNGGFVTTREVVEMTRRILKLNRDFEYWAGDEEFYRCAASTPRSNCVLDNGKLLGAGVTIRPVEEALEEALENWRPMVEFVPGLGG